MSPKLRITYHLTCATGEDATAKARDIAFEQTVELPDDCLSEAIRESIVGEVERVDPLPSGRWEAVISYHAHVVDDVPQLLNVLFGNISMKAGIRVAEIDWPSAVLDRFPGPSMGVDGVRRMCDAPHRPLFCTALKPLGLSATELADRCAQFARGGIDIIKDDHGLTNQPTAPFRERVERCQEAITNANTQTGGASLYFPNVTAGGNELHERVKFARSAGCRGVLVAPLLVGLDTVRRMAESGGLAVLAHPALAGAFFHVEHGIAPPVLLGQLFRFVGSDGVIYPNVGGRFTFTSETCRAIHRELRAELGAVKRAFPVPAGGIDAAHIDDWIDRYGADTIFLVGGSLYAQGDLEQASRQLVESVRQRAI